MKALVQHIVNPFSSTELLPYPKPNIFANGIS